MAVTPERIEKLKNTLSLLKQAEVQELKPKQRQLALMGFCLAKLDEDIIYQLCFNYGRDLITQIEIFLKEHDNG